MLALVASIFFVLPLTLLAQSTSQHSDAALAVAKKLLYDGQSDSARDHLKAAIAIDKTNSELWFWLALANVNLNEIKDAVTAFETSIELNPNFADAHEGLADALLRSSRLAVASDEARKALELKPEYPLAHYTLAFINFRARRVADTVSEADAAIAQDPSFADAYLLKAQALINLYSTTTGLDDETKARYAELRASAAEPLRKYCELTTNPTKAEIWGYVANNLDVDQPPQPSTQINIFSGKEVTTKARLISKPEPQYTEEARRYQVQGRIVLKAVFASSGRVTNIRVFETLPAGLTEQAIRAARAIQFTPAVLDGTPVSMWIQLEYNFNLF